MWEKSNPMPAGGFNITNAYEFIIVFGNKLNSNKTYTKNHLTTSVSKMFKTHKAVMHKEVARFFIENFTQENDIILDPFIGSGTTAVACEKLGRKWIGIELSKDYCDETIRRFEIERTQNKFDFV